MAVGTQAYSNHPHVPAASLASLRFRQFAIVVTVIAPWEKKITNVTKNRVDDRAVLEGDSFGLDHSLRSRGFFLNRRCRNVALGLRRRRRRRRGRVESILDESNRTPTSSLAYFSELENLEKKSEFLV